MTATTTPKENRSPSFTEFVIIISLMMSIPALSIDAMLPALPDIGSDLHVLQTNDRQLVVAIMFLGLSIGQLIFGPLSDKTGRKPPVYAGFAIYIGGALLSAFAVTFPMMLAGRLLQGIGASGPRSIMLALVRDRYAGRLMARVMSFVMTVFIVVPMIAPSLGQFILGFADWRAIFFAFVIIALTIGTWFAIRMPETLSKERRVPFSLRRIVNATIEIVKNRTAIGYTLSAGLIGGAFLGYLNSAQQILGEQYALGDRFPLFFAINAGAIGLASVLNSRLVMRFGMRFLVRWALRIIVTLAVIALGFSLLTSGHPPFWFLMAYIISTFFCIGILFGNQNSLAMEPLGHLAGLGAAIVGSLGTLIQLQLGTLIGQRYNGTIIPLVLGLGILSLIALLVVIWAEKETAHS